MRRTSLATALLVGTCLLSSCGGSSDDPGTGATASTPSASPDESPAGTEDASGATGSGETFADAEPATAAVPLKELPGFEDVRFWEGTEVTPSTRMVTGGLTTDDGQLAVLVFSREAAISEPSSEAEMRYWLKNSNQVTGRAEVLDPVVVDGAELLHARGDNGVEIVDYYVQVVEDGSTLGVLFALPMDLAEAEREERIASVMASIDFA